MIIHFEVVLCRSETDFAAGLKHCDKQKFPVPTMYAKINEKIIVLELTKHFPFKEIVNKFEIASRSLGYFDGLPIGKHRADKFSYSGATNHSYACFVISDGKLFKYFRPQNKISYAVGLE